MGVVRGSRRLAVVAAGVAAVLAASALPVQAAVNEYFSTTGAAGRAEYIRNGDWNLYARDTLTDSHCARWQYRAPGSSTWNWQGSSVCTATEQHATFGRAQYSYRICRTGIGNCSAPKTLY
ncbi:hypothetical protein EG812_21015 [Verrucosispora sp. FIM060022]|nr:hypothetical protein EG812_21015 [Verrucosispora sp. FIM060022]